MPFVTVDTRPESIAPKRLIVAPWSEPKNGKTTFGLGCPAPIYLFNWDYSYEELLGNVRGKEIYVADYALPEFYDYDEYLKQVEQFRRDWIEACEQAAARGGTVVLDKSSQTWAMVGPTLREKTLRTRRERNPNAREMQTDYALANAFMDAILRRPFQYERLNAVYIMGARQVYDDSGRATSQHEPHGWGDTASVVQILLHLFTRKQEILGRVDRCRFDKQLEGMEIQNPSYDTLMSLLS